MQEDNIEKNVCLLILALCIALATGIGKIFQQRDIIARQETRIQNFQTMINSLPVDYRKQAGTKPEVRK